MSDLQNVTATTAENSLYVDVYGAHAAPDDPHSVSVDPVMDDAVSFPIAEQLSAEPTLSHAAVEDDIKDWANKINTAYELGVANILAVGDELIAAKQALGHGNFEKMFTIRKVRFNKRQAEKYMRIARHSVLSDTNQSAFLPPKLNILYPLSGVSESTLLTVLAEIKAKSDQGEENKIDNRGFWEEYFPDLFQAAPALPGVQATPALTAPNPMATESQDGVEASVSEVAPEAAAMQTAPAPMTSNLTLPKSEASPAPEDAAEEVPESQDNEVTADSEPAVPLTQSDINNLKIPILPILDPKNLTRQETVQGYKLNQLWTKKMASEWCNYPAKIRLIMLQSLQNSVLEEEEKKHTAA